MCSKIGVLVSVNVFASKSNNQDLEIPFERFNHELQLFVLFAMDNFA